MPNHSNTVVATPPNPRAAKLRTYFNTTPQGWATKHWGFLNSRTVNGSSPNKQAYAHYLDKGIELRMTREEFVDWVYFNWSKITALTLQGERASVDRIDSSKHYSIDNIRILSLSDNARGGGLATQAKLAAAKMQGLMATPPAHSAL